MPRKLPAPSVPKHLAIAVTFHFKEERLKYLSLISDHFASLADRITVYIVTNVRDQERVAMIDGAVSGKGFDFHFVAPQGLGHPYLLTWSHFAVFHKLMRDESVSHFLYIEDDLLMCREGMEYWMQGRELLRETRFYPSFLRVEQKADSERWYSSDCIGRMDVNRLPSVKFGNELWFVGLPRPYQGLYLHDREQMEEHLFGKSAVPQGHPLGWGIREHAATGLSAWNAPEGFYSRNLLAYWPADGGIDKRSFIHHTPNNYAQSEDHKIPFGQVPVDELLYL